MIFLELAVVLWIINFAVAAVLASFYGWGIASGCIAAFWVYLALLASIGSISDISAGARGLSPLQRLHRSVRLFGTLCLGMFGVAIFPIFHCGLLIHERFRGGLGREVCLTSRAMR